MMKKNIIIISVVGFTVFIGSFFFAPTVFAGYLCGDCGLPQNCPETCEDDTYCYWGFGDYCSIYKCGYNYREEKTSCDNYCEGSMWYHDASPQCTTSGWDCNYQVTECPADSYVCTGTNICGTSEGEDKVFRDYSCVAGTGCEFFDTPVETCRCDAEDIGDTCTDYNGCLMGSCSSTPYTDRCSDAKEACLDYDKEECNVNSACCKFLEPDQCLSKSCDEFTTQTSCEGCGEGGCKWIEGVGCKSAKTIDYYISSKTPNICSSKFWDCGGGAWECVSDCERRREIQYCSNATCVGSGVYEYEYCPTGTRCDAGQCIATGACGYSDWNACYDECTKQRDVYRCDGIGNCNYDTGEDDIQDCSGPFKCEANGNCPGTTCGFSCGADSQCDNKSPGSSWCTQTDTSCTENTCDSSCQYTFNTKTDGWYCTTGDIKEYRDYYCDGGTATCKYNITSSYDCDNNNGCSNGYYLNYKCSGGECAVDTSTCTEECCDAYHGNSDAYCSGGICYSPGPPVTTILCNGVDCVEWYNTDVEITLNCSDQGSGCANTYYCIDQTNTCSPTTTYTGVFYVTPEGTNYVRFYSIDNTGHLEEIKSQIVRIDKTPPSEVSVTGAPVDWQNTDATADVSCTDALSGCNTDSYRLKIYSTDPGTCSTDYTEYTLIPPQTISSHSWVCAAAKDSAENIGFSSPEEFKVDKVSPSSEITFPESDSWYDQDFLVQVSDSDKGGSGLNESECYYHVCRDWDETGLECLNNDWSKSWATRYCNSTFSVTVGDVGEGKDCEREKICAVFVLSKDNAGNESDWNYQWYNIGPPPVPSDPPQAINLEADPDNPTLCCGIASYPPVWFHWQFFDFDEGDTQSAYQIQVDEDPNFGSPIDSGIINSSSEEFIFQPPYPTFSFDTTYYWRVRVWDYGKNQSDCGNPDGWCYPPNPIVFDAWTQSSQADFEAGTLYQVDTLSSPGDVKIAQKNCWGIGGSCDTNCKWSSTSYQSYYYSGGCRETAYCQSDYSYRGSGTCSSDGTGNCYKLTGARTRYINCSKGSVCGEHCTGSCSSSGLTPTECSACGLTPSEGYCTGTYSCSGISQSYCSDPELTGCSWDPEGPCEGTMTLDCSLYLEPECKLHECCDWNLRFGGCVPKSCSLITEGNCGLPCIGCSWDPAGPCVGSGGSCSGLSESLCSYLTSFGCTWYPASCTGDCSCANITDPDNCTVCPGCDWTAYKWTPNLTPSGGITVYSSRTSCSFYKYYSSGTITSQVYDTGIVGASWDRLYWDETLPSGTDITFEVRASDTFFNKDDPAPSWISVGGTSPITSGLPSGRYQQWRATLITTDYANTPTLSKVRTIYSTGTSTTNPGDSFTTILHPFPEVNFDWSPKSPTVEEVVQFCSVYEEVTIPCPPEEEPCPVRVVCPEDVSVCYSGPGNQNPVSCVGTTFLWEIPSDASFVPPTEADSPNPQIKFLGSDVKLKITDIDGYGPCSKTETIPVTLPFPEWREIPSF